MKRKYPVSLKDDFNSTHGKCIRYDFKLHREASGLKLFIYILHESRKCDFKDVPRPYKLLISASTLNLSSRLQAVNPTPSHMLLQAAVPPVALLETVGAMESYYSPGLPLRYTYHTVT